MPQPFLNYHQKITVGMGSKTEMECGNKKEMKASQKTVSKKPLSNIQLGCFQKIVMRKQELSS
jgi:hypothetical protein